MFLSPPQSLVEAFLQSYLSLRYHLFLLSHESLLSYAILVSNAPHDIIILLQQTTLFSRLHIKINKIILRLRLRLKFELSSVGSKSLIFNPFFILFYHFDYLIYSSQEFCYFLPWI